ncbi:unnamed protein product [Ectocarpus sp. CCAP 1310/34]|nr:unnamed protein product [Ectocarpus sp. CCAP 1310/34]
MVQARGGSGGDLARLEGPVKHVVAYSGVHVAPGPATKGGVYDAWFRAGGTRALLYTAARVVDELAAVASEASAKGASGQVRDRAEVLAREGRELLGELLRTVAVLLSSGPVHREEFLQVDAFQEVELLGAALQGVLLDFRLWSDAGVEAQALLLEGVSSVAAFWQAERRVAQLRAFVGPQLLLDVLRVHVCTADRAPPRAQKRPSTSAAPPAASPSHAADGSVIARPVTPKSKRGSGFRDGSSGSGGGGGSGGAAGEPLERCVGACMRMLHAMLRSELSDDVQAASSFIEAAGGGDRAPGGALGSRGMDASERAKYVRMSFLEEDFGDSFGLDGSGWKDGVLREAGVDGAVEDPGSEVTAAAAAAAGEADGVNAAVVCLQECQSPDLQRGVLGVLLGLRKDGLIKDFLRRKLLRSMFLWEAAPILLSKKGYSTDVRRDCLALSLWLLWETHAAGDERSLALSSKTRRHRRPSVSAFPASGGGGGGGNASSAPDLAKALDAENLVLGEDGGRGQGAADGGDAASGRDVLAAVRGQYWSAHLMLARTVALAVSQEAWGTIPGLLSPSPAPIGEDVVEVALSGGQVSAATEETVGKRAAKGGGGGGGGGGHNSDAGDAESGSSSSGGGGKRASLWLSLPFLAALLPGASPSTRQQAAMSINIALKGNVAARKALLRLSESSWADALIELALCERELDDPFAAGATGAAEGAASGGSLKRPSSRGGGGCGWESVERFGDGAVSTPVGETSLCEELALDAAGCVVADSIVERPRGWTILRPLLASLDRAVVQRVGLDRSGREWQRVALCKLSSTVLQRVARGSGRWTELTLDGLNKLMLLVEERLFPGDELAAAMAAAAATVAAGGDSHQENGGGEAGGLGVAGGAEEGNRPVLGSSGGQSSFDMEGSWGEDGTAAGSLSHLVECMLEIVRGLRSMLSNEPLPATGHRAPVAAVAAAAAAAAGDVGLRTRACNALWPALRALGRVPVLRDVGTELSRVVYHEVFLSLQVLLSLPEVTPAAGKSATLEAFLSLRKALSVCDEDLSRPDPSASGSAWGWGRRSTSWGRRKRANGPFDPDAAALAMEKRGLLGAVAMAAVQNLHTLPSAETAAAEDAAGDNAAETARDRRAEATGRPAPRQAKGGGAAPATATVAPKASAAVAEMLTGASGCEDMDEIFKSLSAVLAEAQAESRQDYADFVPLFRNMGSGRRGSSSSLSSSFNAGGGGGGGARGGSAALGGYASAHPPASYTMPFGLPPPLHRVRLFRDAGEFAWPAEPPGPHGPPRPYTPSSGAGEDAAAVAAAAAAGDSSPPDAAAVAAKALQQLPPRGSLIFGLGGAAAAESLAATVLAEHRLVVEEEHLRLEYAMAALDAAGARARRHWRRVSRLAEAEAEAEAWPWVGEEKGAAAAAAATYRRAGGERLTGLHHDCRWKLAGNEHEGSEPGRYRPVLQPVLAAPSSSPSSSASVVPAEDLSASAMSMEDVGLQLARKCSRYIVDIVKTEATGDALADAGGGGGGGGGNGDNNGGENNEEDEEDEEEDVWGVIGALSPAADISGDPETAAAGSSGTDEAAIVAAALDVVEEVSSTGESPLTRAQREEDERRLVEARVRQTLAAVAGRQDGGAGPRVDLGPGAARWRMAVAIAAEAASGLGVTETVVLVTPKGNRRGRLSLVDKFLSFMPESATADGDTGRDGGSGGGGGGTSSGAGAAKAYTWATDQVERVRKRRYRLRESALEVFLRRGKRRSLFVDFGPESKDQGRRNDFIRALETRCPSGSSESSDASRLLKAWQRRRISNFEYLMGLNTLAGRSFNDLCQYPVFPWVLSDYTSDELDLSDDKVFRDLKKPMGAVNPERLAEFIDRYRSFDDPDIPSFMYGSHYSTAVGVVLHYLVRLQPFAELHKEMQNGTFDVADRLFSSVARSWDMCTSALSEVKELTPEWYSLPDFLTNVNGFAFGKAQDGTEINDVQLPPWAGGPADFILKHRAALESDYVSQNLHHWIDLIFGYKQRGPAAEKAHNVFYYLTYSGAVDLANIQDEGLRRATELQIAHFGQCPAQLFGRPHPARGQRGQGVPRPVVASFRGLERWRESSRLASVRSVQRVPSVSLKQVGVRACRALADGRLLSVNGLGVIEQFNYAWRDWQLPASDSSAVAAATATGVETAAEGEEEEAEEEEEEEGVVGGDREEEPGVEAKSGSGTGGGGGGSSSSNSPPRQRTRRRTQNNRPPVASGICVERRMVHFTHVPRIPLGAKPAVDSRGEEAAGAPGDWPPPLPAPPVCFSPSGRYLFSGGHESGALLMWQFDYNTGQVCGEMALHGHSAPVTCLALCGLEAKDSDLVLSGAADGTALLWSIRRLAPNYISDSLRRPTARRCPALVVRGHGGPVTACAVSDGLGLALTCSDGRALLTAIEGTGPLRALGHQPAGSSVGGGGRGGVLTTAAAVDGGGESASGGGGGGGGRESSAALPQQQQQQLPAARYTACALGETGYCALASSRLAAGDEPGAAAAVLLPVHELEVYTVNGLLTARVSGLSGAVRCLSTAGRGELLVVGGDGLMLEVRTMASLAPVWSLDPESWVTIDCFSGAGGGGGVPRGATRGAGAATTPNVPPSVECVELGPNPNAPVLVCVGTSDGSLLVQALPDAEEWLRNNLIVAVGSMIISAPGKVLKGTVNTVHSIATKSIRGAGGLVNTTGDIAKEVVGEVGTLAMGVRRAGLIRGVLGYWNRDEGGLEEEQGREA